MSQPATIEARILAEVGDTPDNRVSANLAAWWASHADKGLYGGPLQYLYTKRDALDAAIMYYALQVQTVIGDVQVFYQQIAQRLDALRTEISAEIQLQEARRLSAAGAVSGTLTTTAPVSPPNGVFDSNDPRYQGSPYTVRWYGGYGRRAY